MNLEDKKRPSDNKEIDNEFKWLEESNSEMALKEDVCHRHHTKSDLYHIANFYHV